jgi:hypothetical protein
MLIPVDGNSLPPSCPLVAGFILIDEGNVRLRE